MRVRQARDGRTAQPEPVSQPEPALLLARAALPVACAVLTVVLLGPVLAPGFVLAYDMVFTPRQPLLPDSLGLGPALPRAVPADAVVAVLTTAVPGALVQKAVLFASVFAAALGAGRLVPTDSTPVRLVAATVYGWNAYLAERLFIGHWGLLVAYASLPWVVAAGLRLRTAGRPQPRAWAALVLAMAPAALAPTGGILATAAAVAAAGARRAPLTLAIGLLLNGPWLAPAVLRPVRAVSDPAAVDAFASRGEGTGGPVVSVLTLGGIWNADVVPDSRHSPVLPVVALLLIAAAAYGVRRLAADWGRAPAVAFAALAVGGVLIALAGTLPGTAAGLRWLVANVPGAGLLRDGQKWAAWWALLAALGAALAVEHLARRLAGTIGRTAVLAGAALLPFALLPDLAWGGLGRLTPVEYPRDWYAVRDLLALDDRRGAVLVLPFQPYRQFGWNGERPQLDPAPRFLPRGTVVDDTLYVGDRPVQGEDPAAAAVRAAPEDWATADAHGVGWVLVEHGTPGRVDRNALDRLVPVYGGRWLTLYRIPGDIGSPTVPAAPRIPVLLVDVAAVLLIGLALLRRWLPIGTFRPGRRELKWV